MTSLIRDATMARCLLEGMWKSRRGCTSDVTTKMTLIGTKLGVGYEPLCCIKNVGGVYVPAWDNK